MNRFQTSEQKVDELGVDGHCIKHYKVKLMSIVVSVRENSIRIFVFYYFCSSFKHPLITEGSS